MPEGFLFDTVTCSRWRRGDRMLEQRLIPDEHRTGCAPSLAKTKPRRQNVINTRGPESEVGPRFVGPIP